MVRDYCISRSNISVSSVHVSSFFFQRKTLFSYKQIEMTISQINENVDRIIDYVQKRRVCVCAAGCLPVE